MKFNVNDFKNHRSNVLELIDVIEDDLSIQIKLDMKMRTVDVRK